MINGHVKILFAGTERTTLKAGSSINITWHLAYPHRGGFRLEVCYPFDCLIVFVIDVLTRSYMWTWYILTRKNELEIVL